MNVFEKLMIDHQLKTKEQLRQAPKVLIPYSPPSKKMQKLMEEQMHLLTFFQRVNPLDTTKPDDPKLRPYVQKVASFRHYFPISSSNIERMDADTKREILAYWSEGVEKTIQRHARVLTCGNPEIREVDLQSIFHEPMMALTRSFLHQDSLTGGVAFLYQVTERALSHTSRIRPSFMRDLVVVWEERIKKGIATPDLVKTYQGYQVRFLEQHLEALFTDQDPTRALPALLHINGYLPYVNWTRREILERGEQSFLFFLKLLEQVGEKKQALAEKLQTDPSLRNTYIKRRQQYDDLRSQLTHALEVFAKLADETTP